MERYRYNRLTRRVDRLYIRDMQREAKAHGGTSGADPERGEVGYPIMHPPLKQESIEALMVTSPFYLTISDIYR